MPPFANEDMGPSSITTAELALAFSGLPEDDMAAHAAAHAAAAAGNINGAAGSYVGVPFGAAPAPGFPATGLPGIAVDHLGRPPAVDHLGRPPPAGGPESGPAKKRRRAPDSAGAIGVPNPAGIPGPAGTVPVPLATTQAQVNAFLATSASAVAAAAAAVAAGAVSMAPPSSFGDPAAYHAAYTHELMASMGAAGVGVGVGAVGSSGLLLPMSDVSVPTSSAVVPGVSPPPFVTTTADADAAAAAAVAAAGMTSMVTTDVGVAATPAPVVGVTPMIMSAEQPGVVSGVGDAAAVAGAVGVAGAGAVAPIMMGMESMPAAAMAAVGSKCAVTDCIAPVRGCYVFCGTTAAGVEGERCEIRVM